MTTTTPRDRKTIAQGFLYLSVPDSLTEGLHNMTREIGVRLVIGVREWRPGNRLV